MSVKQLNPYLYFNGDAARAIAHYERALGARTERLVRHGDVQGMPVAAEQRDRVMHALLRVGEGVLMVSDSMPDSPVAFQGNVEVSLEFDDLADMTKRFEALAAGGKVTSPLQDAFWGATFGTLTDPFGVRWMMTGPKKS